MNWKLTLLLLSIMLFSGCTPGEGAKLSEAVFFHNDEAIEKDISNREKTEIINIIKTSSFSPLQADTIFPYNGESIDLSFKLELNEIERSYYLAIDNGHLLRRNPMLSSTISDEVATLSAMQIEVFTKAFDIVSTDEDEGIYQEIMMVTYDYGFHIPDKATALLDGSRFFFDLKDYGINTEIIAGDIFKIYYKGEMITQMTYPSRVDTSRMTILDVRRTRAIVIRGSLLGVPGSDTYNFVAVDYSASVFPEYVVNDDCTYNTINMYYDDIVYASFRADDETGNPSIQAIYSYIPNRAL